MSERIRRYAVAVDREPGAVVIDVYDGLTGVRRVFRLPACWEPDARELARRIEAMQQDEPLPGPGWPRR